MKLTNKITWITLGCAALILSPLASAAPEDNVTYNTTTPSTSASFTKDFSLSAFDTNLGTLQSITFTYGIPISVSGYVYNSSDFESGFGGDIVVSNSVTGDGEGLGLSAISDDAAVGSTVPPGPKEYTGTGDAANSVSIPSLDFTSWESAGRGALDFTFEAGTPSFSGTHGSGVTVENPSAVESGSFSVEYFYTPADVPEASSANLLAAIVALAIGFKTFRLVRPSRTAA